MPKNAGSGVIATVRFRISRPSLIKEHPKFGGFSVDAVIYPDKFNEEDERAHAAMIRLADFACAEKWGKDVTFDALKETGGRTPMRPSESKDSWLADFGPGTFVCSLKNRSNAPAIYSADRMRLDVGNFDEEELAKAAYPGRWARASISARAWNYQDTSGLSFDLHGVQLLERADRFEAWRPPPLPEEEISKVFGDTGETDDVPF